MFSCGNFNIIKPGIINTMTRVEKAICDIDGVICKNISKIDLSDRGTESQNILQQLRHFVEHIAIKECFGDSDVEISYSNITGAMSHLRTRGELSFLRKFHDLLEKSVSHYTLDEGNSERLMLKYYEYLLRIKQHLKDNFGVEVLKNIEEFPVDLDVSSQEYHKKISNEIVSLLPEAKGSTDRYYIHKVKPFFVDQRVFYEVTFRTANDRSSKFDRVIAFTSLDIENNYASRLTLVDSYIEVLGKQMPIKIVRHCEISIRPCEINNFARIFDFDMNVQTNSAEYRNLMSYLTESKMSLLDIVDSEDKFYKNLKSNITKTSQKIQFFTLLDIVRSLSVNKRDGGNVVRYLLLRLNNRITKSQFYHEKCSMLSNLRLSFGCIPFDQMPFNTSLIKHNPKIVDVFESIDVTGRVHELLARHVKNNVEHRGVLYTPKDELDHFEDIDSLIKEYNSRLYRKHTHRKLQAYKDNVFIKSYEDDTLSIINKLTELSSKGINGYDSAVDSWLKKSTYVIDSSEKKQALRKLFLDSKVALIYGAAGTGKSTMINHISNYFHDKKKLYLANTNPAIDNLRRKVNTSNCEFRTVAKQIFTNNDATEYDLLFIDECSTVSNSDLLKVIEKTSYKLLVLVGDVYQIESIMFGNWFNAAQSFIAKTSVFELKEPYRANNTKLLNLWSKVRKIDDDILEHIAKNDYSVALNESVFHQSNPDEIILCLNYDGLYGINNVNKFLQSNNDNKAFNWGVSTFKVGDPVLFNELDRFKPLIYNNLKGQIVGIAATKTRDKVRFDVAIDKTIDESETWGLDLKWIRNEDNGRSVVQFVVNRHQNTDEDDESLITVVPFQVAYAVSIHKAQGLEYGSVKVVITDEIEEAVTHNLFYTAITRATDDLKIYWSPEVEKKILESMEHKVNKRDVALLSSKYNLKST